MAVAMLVPSLARDAQAAQVGVVNGSLGYFGDSGEANVVTFAVEGSTVTVTDEGATITVRGGCTAQSPNQVVCPGVTGISASLRDGDDRAAATAPGTGPLSVNGDSGNDTITVDGPAPQVVGGSGSDTLTGGSGKDSIDGEGVDGDNRFGPQAQAADGNDVIVGNAGGDFLRGGSGHDVLDGGDGEDQAYGDPDIAFGAPPGPPVSPGNDRVLGGPGDDSLIGGSGGDWVDGGPGRDDLEYTQSAPGAPDVGDVYIGGTGPAPDPDAPSPDRALRDSDALGAYRFRTGAVTIDMKEPGGDGAAGEGDTVSADIEGVATGSGDDVVLASSLDHSGLLATQYIVTGEGDDRVDGRGGGDSIDLGTGDDSAVSDDGGWDRVTCGPGSDAVVVDAIDLLDAACERVTSKAATGTSGADTFSGTKAADTIDGGAGGDRISGGAGNDRLSGGSGRDVLSGDSGGDVLTGGIGRDRLLGGAGRDTLNAADGSRDTVKCGSGRDTARVDAADRVSGCERVVRTRR